MFNAPEFAYQPTLAQQRGEIAKHKVVIIGAGPVGLTAALDCAAHGIECVVFDDNNTVSVGSRALCYGKRSLEVWQRLGVATPILEKGVQWQIGKTFFKDDLAYQFDLLPEDGHEMPGMVNLQQYYLEDYLVKACLDSPLIHLNWKHKLTSIEQTPTHVNAVVETPDGALSVQADWLLACDGASSKTRAMVGAAFTGREFDDQFLIADVVMKSDFPIERWFWFDPPFHPDQSVLLHRQSDGVWRIDFQLGQDADTDFYRQPENVEPLLKKMLDDDVEFEMAWQSVYRFACRRMETFRHNRVIFAGDSAHQVSPFGARGANSGVQDIDNLTWKLKLVLDGKASEKLLDTYCEERQEAADENIGHSSRATDFMTPKTRTSKITRDTILEMSKSFEFAKPFVNSGRLSKASQYHLSSLNIADDAEFHSPMCSGMFCTDAPVSVDGQADWLLHHLGGDFALLIFDEQFTEKTLSLSGLSINCLVVGRDVIDTDGVLTERYEGQAGTVYLIRPDQYVAARWREFDSAKIEQALQQFLI